jgi:hypothetical protein
MSYDPQRSHRRPQVADEGPAPVDALLGGESAGAAEAAESAMSVPEPADRTAEAPPGDALGSRLPAEDVGRIEPMPAPMPTPPPARGGGRAVVVVAAIVALVLLLLWRRRRHRD